MRDALDVSVQRAIVHKIDHVGDGTVFSEVELDLGGNEMLREYFGRQVANALGDDNTHPAKFVATGTQDARNECMRILGDAKKFVPSSQRLAELLRQAMAGDNRIAPGSLAVCVYTASNYPGTSFLALIKLDPGKALVQTVEKVGGKQRVSFAVQQNVMPTDKERLHKAALIPPEGTMPKYDLLLLDQQAAVKPAAFFASAFLQTAFVFDARTATDAVFDAITKARADANLTVAESFDVQHWLGGVLQNDKVRISALVKRIPVAKEKRQAFADQLHAMLPGEEEIELDPEHAQKKLLKKTRFRGDHGIRFEVFTQNFDQVVKVEKQETQKGVVVTTVRLKVPNLQWTK